MKKNGIMTNTIFVVTLLIMLVFVPLTSAPPEGVTEISG